MESTNSKPMENPKIEAVWIDELEPQKTELSEEQLIAGHKLGQEISSLSKEWAIEDNYNSHLPRVYEVAQKTLQGLLSGPNFNILLINSMQASERMTLGQIVVNEAWDMAEALVEKYESKLSEENCKSL